MSLAALLILPVTASGLQLLTVLVRDTLVAGFFLACRRLTKEAICFNKTGSQSETTFFFREEKVEGTLAMVQYQSISSPAGVFFVQMEHKHCHAFKPLRLKMQQTLTVHAQYNGDL